MSFKVAFHTLGCKVNYYETEALKGIFIREGFQVVGRGETADVYVFNTCCVTHTAERKSRQAIRRARKINPKAVIAVMGCYGQVNPQEVAALTGADLVIGTENRLALPELLRKKLSGEEVFLTAGLTQEEPVFEDMPWLPEQGRTRAFLKIQEGCNQFCSYCIIPYARGPLRSLSPERGLKYLQEISRAGYKEVVLTGIRLGLYGVDLKPPASLASFLNLIKEVQGIQRVRLSSIEPSDFTEELIEVLVEEKRICPHLHIPLQSGDDEVLKMMGRPYDTSFFSSLLRRLRKKIKDLAVSSDVIVGFPGEEERHFRNSLNFVRECAFSRLHVFKFSPRPGTEAAGRKPQVPPEVKEKRSREMITLGEELSRKFRDRFLGRALPVLFEKEVDTPRDERDEMVFMEGFTPNYLRVRALLPGWYRGEMGLVRLEKSCHGYVMGTYVKKL